MKKVCSFLFLSVALALANAQDSAPGTPTVMVLNGLKSGTTELDGFIFHEVMRGGEFVKGAPYTATAVSETIQVLADGNRILNKSNAFLARDSEGRTRREETIARIGPLHAQASKLAFITDPITKSEYVLNLEDKTASVHKLAGEKVFTTQKRLQGKVLQSSEHADIKQEALPNETIDGLSCEHIMQTETIPAESIGNERPIVITQETCASPELHLLVLRKRNDPRFGETMYKLTDIRRGEPDASLFQVPTDFKVVDDKLTIRVRD